MGTYTEFSCKIKLRKDTPVEVIEFLDRAVNYHDFTNDFSHSFFKTSRFDLMLVANNFGTTKGSTFTKPFNYWILELHTEFKNYDNEIYHFIHWITPYVVGRKKKQYVGWSKTEGMENRNYLHIHRVTVKDAIIHKKAGIAKRIKELEAFIQSDKFNAQSGFHKESDISSLATMKIVSEHLEKKLKYYCK